MRIPVLICAFRVFLSMVICQSGSEYGWQHSLPSNSQPNFPSSSQLNLLSNSHRNFTQYSQPSLLSAWQTHSQPTWQAHPQPHSQLPLQPHSQENPPITEVGTKSQLQPNFSYYWQTSLPSTSQPYSQSPSQPHSQPPWQPHWQSPLQPGWQLYSQTPSKPHLKPHSQEHLPIPIPELVVESNGFTVVLFWHDYKLYFVDTYAHKLCAYHAENGNIFCATTVPGFLSFAVLVHGHEDKFVVGVNKKILLITWNSNENNENPPWGLLETVDPRIPDNILNYGAVDSLGRLLFGTTNKNGLELANVSSLNYDLGLRTHIKGFISCKGFVLDIRASHHAKLYFVNSERHYNVKAYNYHAKNGKISNNKAVFDWKQQNMTGYPGRLTIDRGGKLWMPLDKGSGVIQVDPNIGKVMQYIFIPAYRVGACTFGGPELDILFVSTLRYVQENYNGPHPQKDQGGSIFALRGLGVQGWPSGKYKLNSNLINTKLPENFKESLVQSLF